MNLVIDQGNTICKAALFDCGSEPVEVRTCAKPDATFFEALLKQSDVEAGIFASVGNTDPVLLCWMRQAIPFFVVMNEHTPIPLINAYKTPQTLGMDRLAAMVGARSLEPGRPLLVIDAGTAVTFDFATQNGVFTGGNIAPGVRLRLKALNAYTEKLPLVEPEPDFATLGVDTVSAIRSGVLQGMVYEMDGYVEHLQRLYPSLFTFLTGGDRIYFDGKLKSSIFVCENLVLIGLNSILNHNVHS